MWPRGNREGSRCFRRAAITICIDEIGDSAVLDEKMERDPVSTRTHVPAADRARRCGDEREREKQGEGDRVREREKKRGHGRRPQQRQAAAAEAPSSRKDSAGAPCWPPHPPSTEAGSAAPPGASPSSAGIYRGFIEHQQKIIIGCRREHWPDTGGTSRLSPRRHVRVVLWIKRGDCHPAGPSYSSASPCSAACCPRMGDLSSSCCV
ncbi:unnamed protein product [Pleuronectes platessa]|uniref:Uncharacterized protein n=1 Tax=Pleuronectes platessa TaxID=8262 RepID=A0A9N7TQS7_PLEPL|nr:unnamed protein product [Pleuronectes platessa]